MPASADLPWVYDQITHTYRALTGRGTYLVRWDGYRYRATCNGIWVADGYTAENARAAATLHHAAHDANPAPAKPALPESSVADALRLELTATDPRASHEAVRTAIMRIANTLGITL